jgi:predicted ATP-binding protein involved in virulence
VALIDEIEAHLPLRRQREIVEILRQTFPRLQLIVATQSPLVAEARAHDEVLVLSRDLESGAIAISTGPAAVLH